LLLCHTLRKALLVGHDVVKLACQFVRVICRTGRNNLLATNTQFYFASSMRNNCEIDISCITGCNFSCMQRNPSNFTVNRLWRQLSRFLLVSGYCRHCVKQKSVEFNVFCVLKAVSQSVNGWLSLKSTAFCKILQFSHFVNAFHQYFFIF